ncbi:hypothetical protein SAMN05216389_1117 [Oceanobacillus limi]|uniref:Uncharacterized protein n=1 Tax=Oceanobacillus limi TaxID=930131 RepID=A0A1I0ECB9_9BACI|nr:BC1881 family protein [Oceanobacillus limi]SET42109.1 hypothetical protein SAMN05216389_1117 [Oceanobacillus limi]
MADKQSRELKEGNESNVGNISIKVDVDCSDALTGLKAIQREAKKATQTLRELEAERDRQDEEFGKLFDAHQNLAQQHDDLTVKPLSNATTEELTEELAKREGVRKAEIKPDIRGELLPEGISGYTTFIHGPARVLVVTD